MEPTDASKVVQDYAQLLGIEPESARIYLALSASGPSTVLQLAQRTGVSRTQLYRQLNTLMELHLVATEQLAYGSLFQALSFDNLSHVLQQRQKAVEAAQASLASMSGLVRQLSGSQASAAAVQHYYGIGGIAQALWNVGNAVNGLQTLQNDGPSPLDKAFIKRFHDRLDEQAINALCLSNQMPRTLALFDTNHQWRHIDRELHRITSEAYLYNDTVTLVDYTPDSQLAIEIQQPAVYALMERLFRSLWQLAEPISPSDGN